MDNSVQSAWTEKVFEEQPAEMLLNSAPGSINDPTFDWQAFKDFLLNEDNFDIILNALQKDADAQSVVNQHQVHNKMHQGLTKYTRLQTVVHTVMLWIQCNIAEFKNALMQNRIQLSFKISFLSTVLLWPHLRGPWTILWWPVCCSSSHSKFMTLMEYQCVFSQAFESRYEKTERMCLVLKWPWSKM